MLISLFAVKLEIPACRGFGGIGNNSGLLRGAKVSGDPTLGKFAGDIVNRAVRYRFVNGGYTTRNCVVNGD
jgi:hypothetical protein